ncbi:MAG: hypothetical protein AAB930_02195, partial [Patescibacteria group bacterium]
MDVYLAGKKIALDPKKSIGKGGEADIYDIAGGKALKVFKPPDHPDFANSPQEQQAARARLLEHNDKLRMFPRNLPPKIVRPEELATDRSGKQVVGYSMRLIQNAEVLMRYTDRGFRQGRITNEKMIKIFLGLHPTVAKTHEARAIIGDFNDLNILVLGEEAYIIDADSFQFDKFTAKMFTAKFVDPLLCEADTAGLTLARPHNYNSDWYAYTVMLVESLLFVHPYGGIYRPEDHLRRVAHELRPLHRITIFNPEVRYPKPATPYMVLPDDLLHHFHKVFEKDLRGEFPLRLIETIRWTKCATCGIEHARTYCPNCAHIAPSAIKEAVVVRGKVIATKLKELPAELAQKTAIRFWIHGGRLMKEGQFAPEYVGDVLEGQTHFWVGTDFGFGFYRAGLFTVGFIFNVAGGGINDNVKFPSFPGQLIDATAVFAKDHCWFLLTIQEKGNTINRSMVIDKKGVIEGMTETAANDGSWLSNIYGKCAIGNMLFAATDDGIVRVEIGNGQIIKTKEFPDTES